MMGSVPGSTMTANAVRGLDRMAVAKAAQVAVRPGGMRAVASGKLAVYVGLTVSLWVGNTEVSAGAIAVLDALEHKSDDVFAGNFREDFLDSFNFGRIVPESNVTRHRN